MLGSAVGSAESWYAVYTRARHEKKVAFQLQQHSIEFFLPLYKQEKRWNNGLRVQIELPLFPGYLFTRIPL
ncbi:MAG: antitermination protein NusG, partial [Acidobacteria bacterium]